jgi:transcriptional regulator with XRE-family HTH domain
MSNETPVASPESMARMLAGLNDARKVPRPKRGWMRIFRNGARLSAGEVARRMGVSRHLPLQFEKAEANDSITLRSLRSMADAMGFDLVYGLIPKDDHKPAITSGIRTQPAPAKSSTDSAAGADFKMLKELMKAAGGIK